MAVTPTSFKIRFPEFAAVDDGRIQFFINDADPYFSFRHWGAFIDQGMALWIAHQLAFDAQRTGQTSGFSTGGDSIKVGDVQVTAGQSSGSSGSQFYDKTSYGQEYRRMARMLGCGGLAS